MRLFNFVYRRKCQPHFLFSLSLSLDLSQFVSMVLSVENLNDINHMLFYPFKTITLFIDSLFCDDKEKKASHLNSHLYADDAISLDLGFDFDFVSLHWIFSIRLSHTETRTDR